jgi:hypothetical protein
MHLNAKKIIELMKILHDKLTMKLFKKLVYRRRWGANNNNVIHIDKDINVKTILVKDK